MKMRYWAVIVLIGSLALLWLGGYGRRGLGAFANSIARLQLQEPSVSRDELAAAGGSFGRQRLETVAAPRVALPSEKEAPDTAEELSELVVWMRSLDSAELLRLSNAEYRFEQSELIEMLQGMRGEWVVEALGEFAAAESDPLVKAVLVEGLVGGFADERVRDPRMPAVLESLMSQMKLSSEDPHEVANGLAAYAYMSCMASGEDYVTWMQRHLQDSDNGNFLTRGYLHMGQCEGSEGLLSQVLSAHPSPEGRMGAVEGLRSLASTGRLLPEEVTRLAAEALGGESNERNRLLLYEMMISQGGEGALALVEGQLRNGEIGDIRETAAMLALKLPPGRAQALFQDLLAEHELAGEDRQAVYNAMAVMPGDSGAEFLFSIAKNEDLDSNQRLAGLMALWNREMEAGLEGELRDVLENTRDSTLRAEALRMLAFSDEAEGGVDLREIAMLDRDPLLRAEAIQLAAMQPADDTREWLEERLLAEESLDGKASALGALVFQAHYSGDGERVLGYLERARKLTSDESALALIAEGERMVADYDPRRLELELEADAEFYRTVARYTDGPAARAFERQARQVQQIVASLKRAQVARARGR
jgi:hypothetical protein